MAHELARFASTHPPDVWLENLPSSTVPFLMDNVTMVYLIKLP